MKPIKKIFSLKTYGINHLSNKLTNSFIDNPIIIIGVGRSGTSALLQSMGKHKQIISTDREVPSISFIGKIAYEVSKGTESKHLQRCIRLSTESLFLKLKNLAFEMAWGEKLGAKRITKYYVKNLIKTFKTRMWAVRAFPSELEAEGLKTIFPGIRFLYIHRNGLDVVQSRMNYKAFQQMSFEENCRSWANGYKKFNYLNFNENAKVIQFSEFIKQRERVFKSSYDFLGLEIDNAPFEYAKNNLLISKDTPKHENIRNVDVTKKISEREKSYTKWTNEQKDIFKEICGEAMRELNYTIPF